MHIYNVTPDWIPTTHFYDVTINSTSTTFYNYTYWCNYYKKKLTFDTTQVVRVVFMWIFFLLSSLGNTFVLHCLWTKKRKSHVHIITLHLTLADLAFTFFSIPTDAMWNVTMAWLAGDALCKVMQVLKQFGMYISSCMVVVISLDRVFSILSPMSPLSQQKRRTKIFLTVAWTISFLSALPAGYLFSVTSKVFCEGDAAFTQCVDFKVIRSKDRRHSYYFFTMAMSFIVPFVIALISYSLVLYEIKNMQKRERARMGRKCSTSSSSIAKAKKKALILTTMVTATFIVLWGPYYGFGIYTWFVKPEARKIPKQVSSWLFSLMYIHPTLHPLMYGVFMKDVRKKFLRIVRLTLWFTSCGMISSSSEKSKVGTTLAKPHSKSTTSSCCSCSRKDHFPLKDLLHPSEARHCNSRRSSTRTSRTVIHDDLHLPHSQALSDFQGNRTHFLFKEHKFLALDSGEEAHKCFHDVIQR